MSEFNITIQTEDFDVGAEYQLLRKLAGDSGAIVTFTGLVREIYEPASVNASGERIQSLTLEHYPGMTEKALTAMAEEAMGRWDLGDVLIIHRFGRMGPDERIMMVATASRHRKDAFAAAEFLMDYLKSRAPFWKKEHTGEVADWVAARDEDEDALDRWQP